jgi:hypothetical protein
VVSMYTERTEIRVCLRKSFIDLTAQSTTAEVSSVLLLNKSVDIDDYDYMFQFLLANGPSTSHVVFLPLRS